MSLLARPLLSAVRRGGPSARLSKCLRRQFGSTSPACAIRATFTMTDDEELNQTLKTIQDTIIFPALLPPRQRKIVFDPKKREYMEENPVIIEVDDQEFRLKSLDRFHGIENSKTIFIKALSRMRTPADWANLAPLLAGYKKAGIQLLNCHWGKVARLAGSNGNIQAVIECAKQWRETGLTLANREMMTRIFVHNNERIYKSGYDKSKTLRALAQSEMLLDLLSMPQHALPVSESGSSPACARLIRGMHLYATCSAMIARQKDGEDISKEIGLLRGQLTSYMSIWDSTSLEDIGQIPELSDLNPTADRQAVKRRRRSSALNGCGYIQVISQVLKGIELAVQLVGYDARYLTRVRDALEAHLKGFVRTAYNWEEYWKDEYATIVGRRPQWPPNERPAAEAQPRTEEAGESHLEASGGTSTV
ncbi:hypothetical protein XA68_18251 [Ophiocordyceps unilateralis]|uniref:Uncharacterized protein n=1 Tax=Ophiocordyceps unilateralis TaxID=268505 RepID=A0A2A9PJM6_OPHUN|nr:hypothetical protein XA68_18251 [Ophiocordyceps unilateralis]